MTYRIHILIDACFHILDYMSYIGFHVMKIDIQYLARVVCQLFLLILSYIEPNAFRIFYINMFVQHQQDYPLITAIVCTTVALFLPD